jgi:ABC-type hemin transport system ATPase subunit
MATEKASILERRAEYEQMKGMEKGRIETLRALIQHAQDIYSDQIARLLAAPLRTLPLYEAQYILERALEGRDDFFRTRVKQDVLAILNGRR